MVKQAHTTAPINPFAAALIAAALFVPACLLVPVATYAVNPDLDGATLLMVLLTFGLTGLAATTAWALLLQKFPRRAGQVLATSTVALAFALYIQTNILTPIVEFDLSGELINWNTLGHWPAWEALIFSGIFMLSLMAMLKFKQARTSVAGFILVAATISMSNEILRGTSAYATDVSTVEDSEISDEVYGFSPERNVIHMMPDGVQSDIAAEILRANPELAESLEGFILFEANLGGFRSTAPTLPTLFNGEMYNLDNGFVAREVRQQIGEKSYANVLQDAGYRTDFAASSLLSCLRGADTCVHLPWSADFRSRGYETEAAAWAVDLGLIADLALFRQFPAIIKRMIYAEGEWQLSSRVAEATTDYTIHAPVLLEWQANAWVSEDPRPRYKWYHWVGTHPPHMWDRNCNYIGRQEGSRDVVTAQTECVLKRIGNLALHLKELGVYDETMIAISSDHGVFQSALDVDNYVDNDILSLPAIGQARPLFMVKPLNRSGPLVFEDTPTHIIDAAPTILGEVNLEHQQYPGLDVVNQRVHPARKREYQLYARSPFRWTPEPMPAHRYTVHGDTRDWDNWRMTAMHSEETPPTRLDNLSDSTVESFVRSLQPAREAERAVIGRDFAVTLSATENTGHALVINARLTQKSTSREAIVFINGQPGPGFSLSGQHTRDQEIRVCLNTSLIHTDQANTLHIRFADYDAEVEIRIRNIALEPDASCATENHLSAE